jgi:hypothetical protein
MIKIENTSVVGWEAAIRGMRNPMNSWDKSDSALTVMNPGDVEFGYEPMCEYIIGPNDLDLMKRLRNAGMDHRKFMRMIIVTVDLTAPLYWWKEFDTYKVGTVANSCSTMHKIHAKEFTLEDFSHDQMFETANGWIDAEDGTKYLSPVTFLEGIVFQMNMYREKYIATKDKKWWDQMIQLLPTSYNQKRTILLNYEVLANIYKSRRNHRLDEWHDLCHWIETLPYSELITGKGDGID